MSTLTSSTGRPASKKTIAGDSEHVGRCDRASWHRFVLGKSGLAPQGIEMVLELVELRQGHRRHVGLAGIRAA
ncbi:MAG: hypothetical protein HC794_02700 [Nitrospiraceae bacterium]|nr:hypothetical protein [Nitrospiraceae bacterium]